MEHEFIASFNRFGLDNPTPVITKRLSLYGNEEPLEKVIERLAKQYNDTKFLDSEKLGNLPEKVRDNYKLELLGDTEVRKEKPTVRNMKEIANTIQKGKKMSGVQDIKLLEKNLDNAKKFQSAATQIKVRNVKIKIKDIEK